VDSAAARSGVRLRAATLADWPLIRKWLADPQIQRWWGPQASSEAEVLMALGSSHAICRIIESARGEPIGYAHAVDASLWGEALPDDLPAGAWDLDIFIAARSHRGSGAGVEALQQLREEVFASTLAVAVCVFASIENEAAVRAYEKAGFRWRRIWNDPVNGPEWFMIADRPAR
jgi:RimJ/RimL family protein N-acetyltransferase